MSYEGDMLRNLKMPERKAVENALLISLFSHNGTIREFAYGENIVDELAEDFGLSPDQKSAYLETIYRKENRTKKSYLWSRLLFRAADSLANNQMVLRPTETLKLTGKREWMLTERGLNRALSLLDMPSKIKDRLPTRSFEVQKIINELNTSPRPDSYIPFDTEKKTKQVSQEVKLRYRGFRHAVMDAYDHRCAICGLKLCSPDSLLWEVEAAHIVPHRENGRDDIWNGLALCRLHHWSFDVGWLSLQDDYSVLIDPKAGRLPSDFAKIYGQMVFDTELFSRILLPKNENSYPHIDAMRWHRGNVFGKAKARQEHDLTNQE